MPTAPVDGHGTELFFEDTGPVPGSTDYTTLVLLHGCWFDGRESDIYIHQNIGINHTTLWCRDLQETYSIRCFFKRPDCARKSKAIPWIKQIHFTRFGRLE